MGHSHSVIKDYIQVEDHQLSNWAYGHFLSMLSPTEISNTSDSQLGGYLHDGSHISGETLRDIQTTPLPHTCPHIIILTHTDKASWQSRFIVSYQLPPQFSCRQWVVIIIIHNVKTN